MRILSRYLLRLHVPPFLFALTGLTMLLLLDQVSRRFGKLVGKGLHGSVIAEVFFYSVPFILAQTFPMAVLIAVLYVFNRLAGDNEVTAIKASGIPLTRLLLPLVAAATVLAGAMTLFNNTVLPESNHRLQVLLTSIAQKKPTFQLREQAVNEVLSGELYVQVARIDRGRNRLEDVVIYDEREGNRSRTIYADSGRMAYSDDQTDLYLTLRQGVTQERLDDEPDAFQRIHFDRLIMKVADVTNQLERGELGGWRGDREMTIGQMSEEVRAGRERAEVAREGSLAYAVTLTESLARGAEAAEGELETAAGAGDTAGGGGDRGGAGAAADGLADAPGAGQVDTAADADGRVDAAAERLTDRRTDTAADTPSGRAEAALRRPSDTAAEAGRGAPADTGALAQELWRARLEASRIRSARDVARRFESYSSQVSSGLATVNQFSVEIHKKYTIPAACIVFVLIGAPIAIRYPQGGMALVVGASLAFFCAYYVSLVGGEELADARILSPFWAMWAPNVLFGILGVGAVWKVTQAGR